MRNLTQRVHDQMTHLKPTRRMLRSVRNKDTIWCAYRKSDIENQYDAAGVKLQASTSQIQVSSFYIHSFLQLQGSKTIL